VLAPADTPKKQVQVLFVAFHNSIWCGVITDWMADMERVPVNDGSATFRKILRFEVARWAKVVAQSGFAATNWANQRPVRGGQSLADGVMHEDLGAHAPRLISVDTVANSPLGYTPRRPTARVWHYLRSRPSPGVPKQPVMRAKRRIWLRKEQWPILLPCLARPHTAWHCRFDTVKVITGIRTPCVGLANFPYSSEYRSGIQPTC